MNILVIGSGGREHAIINSISKSNKCSKIFALPGNGGTELLAENLSGDVNDFELIKKISLKYLRDIENPSQRNTRISKIHQTFGASQGYSGSQPRAARSQRNFLQPLHA